MVRAALVWFVLVGYYGLAYQAIFCSSAANWL